ncbi:hypothetical protein SNEBB_009649 [Seison nebaliae]|nr:hypothetical protein SNEBB_009649 [Seison nebaliae]
MKSWKCGKTARLSVMLGLTFTFFLVEVVCGYISNAISLIADSFHMMSDVVALIIALVSVRMVKRKSPNNTFGWVRAEILGAMVNAVFLLALSLSIALEALKRLITPEKMSNIIVMLIVGACGLAVNLIGLVLFAGHGHSHGHAHGHSHSDEHDSRSLLNESDVEITRPTYDIRCLHETVMEGEMANLVRIQREENVVNMSLVEEDGEQRKANNNDEDDHNNNEKKLLTIAVNNKKKMKKEEEEKKKKTKDTVKSAQQLNMRAVFLHVLADAIGSVIVLISGLIYMYTPEDQKWRLYIDPILSFCLVFIIVLSTLPILKESSLILLQTVPTHLNVELLQKKLLEKIPDITAIHEFHVWQLSGSKIIASAHIRCADIEQYMSIANNIKNFFHKHGIHSTTIQPEFTKYCCQINTKGVNGNDLHSSQCPVGSRVATAINNGQVDGNIPSTECLLQCKDGKCDNDACCTRNTIQRKATSRKDNVNPTV